MGSNGKIKYKMVKEIGRGGFGTVFSGRVQIEPDRIGIYISKNGEKKNYFFSEKQVRTLFSGIELETGDEVAVKIESDKRSNSYKVENDFLYPKFCVPCAFSACLTSKFMQKKHKL